MCFSCREFDAIGVKSKGRGSKTRERFVTHNSQLVNDLEYGDDMHANYFSRHSTSPNHRACIPLLDSRRSDFFLTFPFLSCNVQGHSDVIFCGRFQVFAIRTISSSPNKHPFLIPPNKFSLAIFILVNFIAELYSNCTNILTFFCRDELRLLMY